MVGQSESESLLGSQDRQMRAATLWVAADGHTNATIHQASTFSTEDLHYRNARPVPCPRLLLTRAEGVWGGRTANP